MTEQIVIPEEILKTVSKEMGIWNDEPGKAEIGGMPASLYLRMHDIFPDFKSFEPSTEELKYLYRMASHFYPRLTLVKCKNKCDADNKAEYTQIIFYSNEDRIGDAVCFKGTEGWLDGLLEICGDDLLDSQEDEETEPGTCVGNLTSLDVILRLGRALGKTSSELAKIKEEAVLMLDSMVPKKEIEHD